MAVITEEMKLVIIAEVEKALAGMEDWEDALDESGKKAEEMAKKSEAELRKLEKAANDVANGMLIWTGVVTAGAGAGLKFAGSIESQKVAFEVLTGSAETALELYEQMEDLSIKTPLEPEQVNHAAEALLTFQFAVAEVDDELVRLGDLAKGKPELLDRITTAYGRIHLKGKASMEELNMLTEAGVPILAELSKQYDVTTSELMDMVSKGKVGFTEVQEAVTSLTSEGGQFSGMMEKMSQTMEGKWSTAVGSLKISLADAMGSFVPMAKDMLDTVSELANKFSALDDDSKKAIITLIGISAAAGPILKMSLSIGKASQNMKTLLLFAKSAGPLLTSPWGALALAVGAATAAVILHRKEMRENVREYQSALATSKAAIIDIASTDWIQKLGDWESLDASSLDDYISGTNSKLRSLGSSVKLTRQDIIQLINDIDSFGVDSDIAKQLGITDDEITKIENFRGDTVLLAEAIARLKDAAADSVTSWEKWFDTITGFDPNDFSNDSYGTKGKNAAQAYIISLQEELNSADSFAAAIGQKLDPTPYLQKQKAAIESTLRSFFDIDPDKIDSAFQFDGSDQSINLLVEALKEVDARLEALSAAAKDADKNVSSLFTQMVNDERDAIQGRKDAFEAYKKAQEALSLSSMLGLGEEAEIYINIINSLKEMYGFGKDNLDVTDSEREKLKEISDELGVSEDKAQDIYNIMKALPGITAETAANLSDLKDDIKDSAMASSADLLTDSFAAMGEALANGTSFADSASQSFESFVSGLASEIGTMAITAGLKMIIQGEWEVGLALLAIGGITSFASGFFGGGDYKNYGAYDYESMIPTVMEQEQELYEQRVEYLKDELEAAKKLRDEGLKNLERDINQEFSVLKDLWERNLITDTQFESGMADLNARQDAGEAALQAPVDDAEAIIAAEEAAKKALEDARDQKLATLSQEAFDLQKKLNNMGWWERTFTSHDTTLKHKIDLIDARIAVVENATTIDAINAAALGADFMTSGPQLLMVGDNPGGRERVQVTPVSSPNVNGPQSSGNMVVVQGDIYGIDDLYGKLKEAGFRLQQTGRG